MSANRILHSRDLAMADPDELSKLSAWETDNDIMTMQQTYGSS